MELLLDSLKAEVYSDNSVCSYTKPVIRENKLPNYMKRSLMDYDEIFEDSEIDD